MNERETSQAFNPLEALTVKEAAALLHVSRPTAEKYVKAGELPSVLIGRCRRIRRADLETFLQRRTACPWQRRRPEPMPVCPSTERPASACRDGEEIPF